MNRSITWANPSVPPDEVERRLAEYRRLSFQGQLPAQVVYQEPHVECPWPGCGLRIAGINFQLERMGDAEQVAGWRKAWWLGPGLVGRCPRCNRHVRFDVSDKQAVPDTELSGQALLPDDWEQTAHLVIRPAQPRNGGGG